MRRNREKIRIRIERESHLTNLLDTRVAPWMIALALIFFLGISILFGCLIVMVTPIHTLLPGYLKENQRSATEENLIRLDSLRNVYETNQRFIDNYLRITDVNRLPVDSALINADTISSTGNSLMPPSERERRFVARMEEQERFNISVLAPLAADAVVFSMASDTGVFSSDTKEDETGTILLPREATILSIAEGTVLSSYFSPAEKGYVMVIQHPKGFASRYSGLGRPFVLTGESVESGQIIAESPQPDNKGKREFHIRLWYNGLPVVPYKFIYGRKADSHKDTFGNENSFEAPRGK